MYLKHSLAVIIPAFNEELLISQTLTGMPPEADRIFVVNDGSTDKTKEIIESFNDPRISLLDNGINQGVGASIVNGYKEAIKENIDIMVVMAGDGQMSRQYLPALLAPIVSGEADYSKGNRLIVPGHTEGMSKWRHFGNRILTLCTKIASGYMDIGDPQNGFTAITRKGLLMIDLDKIYPRYGYCNDMLIKMNAVNCRVQDIPIPAIYGREKSKIRYHKYIFTVAPLLLRGFLWRIYNKYFIKR